MTICDETGSERVPVDAGLGVDPGPGEITTTLVEDDSGVGARWSLRRDLDCQGAIVRGLAQYLWGMRAQLGRELRFGRVTESQADVWDEATPLPVAVVYGELGEGSYDGPPHAPVPVEQRGAAVTFDEPDGQIAGLFQTATYSHGRIAVEIRAGSQDELAAIIAVVEDMVSPNLERGGFALCLGHYHGALARFVCQGQSREIVPTEAASGIWIARFRFHATAPVIRVHRRPRADLRVIATVTTGAAR